MLCGSEIFSNDGGYTMITIELTRSQADTLAEFIDTHLLDELTSGTDTKSIDLCNVFVKLKKAMEKHHE
jgi:hypothetical protein